MLLIHQMINIHIIRIEFLNHHLNLTIMNKPTTLVDNQSILDNRIITNNRITLKNRTILNSKFTRKNHCSLRTTIDIPNKIHAINNSRSNHLNNVSDAVQRNIWLHNVTISKDGVNDWWYWLRELLSIPIITFSHLYYNLSQPSQNENYVGYWCKLLVY